MLLLFINVINFECFSAWLKSDDHPVVEKINRRIDLMTNLDMNTAEELQVKLHTFYI